MSRLAMFKNASQLSNPKIGKPRLRIWLHSHHKVSLQGKPQWSISKFQVLPSAERLCKTLAENMALGLQRADFPSQLLAYTARPLYQLRSTWQAFGQFSFIIYSNEYSANLMESCCIAQDVRMWVRWKYVEIRGKTTGNKDAIPGEWIGDRWETNAECTGNEPAMKL